MKITSSFLRKWARQYDSDFKGTDDEKIETEEKERLRRHRFLSLRNLVRIGRWKSPRVIHHLESNDNEKVKEISRLSFCNKDEMERIETLLGSKGGLKGVGYPVASVILHFAFPDRYPIMDFRVIRSLEWEKPSSYNFDFWQMYCQKLSKIAMQFDVELREVDKALWKYDKESSKTYQCGR